MSSLTLVRHGQASFFARSYDQLSELGKQQAWLLGDYWVRRRLVFDEIYTGPRKRQRHTAELVGACYQRAGLAWPEPVTLPEFDEYHLGSMLHKLAPDLEKRDPAFAELAQRYRQSTSDSERVRSFQRMFEALTLDWQTTANTALDLESWAAFSARVRRGIDGIRARPGKGRRVAVFTSGGFIGTSVQLVLAAPARSALEINWRLRNCSLTEFVFTDDRLTLDSFNGVPHLDDTALWTYR